MKKQTYFPNKYLLFINIILINFVNYSFAQNKIIIKRNNYKGYIKLVDRTNSVVLKEYVGGETDIYIDLPTKPLNIEVETGANLPNQSFFNFNVNTDGKIDVASILPKESAFIKTGVSNTLELTTKLIAIDPKKYKFYYQLSALRDSTISSHPAIKIKGKLSLYLIAGLKYAIDNGTNNLLIVIFFGEPESCDPKKDSIPTVVSFRVLASDIIQTDNTIATRVTHGNVLAFRTVCVSIDPKRISEGLPIKYQESTIKTKRTIHLIPGLTTRLDWQTKGCRNTQFFIPL